MDQCTDGALCRDAEHVWSRTRPHQKPACQNTMKACLTNLAARSTGVYSVDTERGERRCRA